MVDMAVVVVCATWDMSTGRPLVVCVDAAV